MGKQNKLINGYNKKVNLSYYTTDVLRHESFPLVEEIWKKLCEEYQVSPKNYNAFVIDELEMDAIIQLMIRDNVINNYSHWISEANIFIRPLNAGDISKYPVYSTNDKIGSLAATVIIPFRALLLQQAIMRFSDTMIYSTDAWFERYVTVLLRLSLGYILLHEIHAKGKFSDYYKWAETVDINDGHMFHFDDEDFKSPSAFFNKISMIVEADESLQEIMEIAKVDLKELALVHGMSVYTTSIFRNAGISDMWDFDEFNNELFGYQSPEGQ